MTFAARAFGPLLDFALPPRCAGCGVIVAGDDAMCLSCWQSLEFLTGAGCALCRAPGVADGMICAPCLADPPAHDGVCAAVAYGDLARSVVLRLKHGGRTGLARLVARAMARNLPIEPALLIPVPLHRWRIWSRGFNQSALIAEHLGRTSGTRVEREWLLRTKATPMLRGLGAKDRISSVRGAFRVAAEAKNQLQGQTVLLVDDVYTSGATTNACARVLKRAGAAKVVVHCWARVTLDD